MNLFVKIMGAYDGKASLDSAKKDIESLDDAADKATKGGVGNFKSALGDVAKVAGGFVLGAGIVNAPSYLMDAAKGAAADEQATARLNTALENLQRSTGASGDELAAWKNQVDDAIDKGAKLAFTDDDVRDSFQSLLAATEDTSEALKRQKAAMDLARGANIPLGTATKMLSKLNEENVEVFKKLGITLGDTATEADALAAVQSKFGGQAEAYAKSSAGQFEQTQIQMAELQESIGTALLPVMALLGQMLSNVIVPAITNGLVPAIDVVASAFQFLIDHSKELAPVFAAVGAVIGTVLIGALVSSTVALYAQATAWLAVAAATIAANLPLIAIIATIGLVVAAIVWLIQNWDMVVEKFPAIGVAVDKVKAAFQGLIDFATGKFLPAIKDAIGAIAPAIDAAKAVIGAAMSAVSAVISAHIEVIKGIFNALSALLRGDFGAAWNALKDTIFGAWQNIAGIVSDGIETIKGMAGKFGEAGTALGKGFLDALKAALLSTGEFAADIGSAVVEAVKAAVNSVIDSINRSLEFKIPVKGLPDIHVDPPDIPHLARGGITTGPTLAVVGDNPGGREAIIPLPADGMLGGGLVVNIYALDSDSVRRAIPEIARQLKVHARQTGFSLA